MSLTARSIWIGFDPDPRQVAAFGVARHSIERHLTDRAIPIRALILEDLQARGLYTRPTERRLGRCYDLLSARDDYNGEISTEFAISRFLVPHLAREGWAVFMDCDMLVRYNLARLFEYLERECSRYAVMCVKHNYAPSNKKKMDGRQQTEYPFKNWSSFTAFQCEHPANKALTLEMINTLPGRDLHRFCWLDENEIGELGPEYNMLVGYTEVENPKVVHFTDAVPCFAGYENIPFASDWRKELLEWAR